VVHSVELIFLQVGDVEAALPFYAKLGFEPRSRDDKGATLERGGTQIVLEAVEGYVPDPNEKVRASIPVPMEMMEALWDEATEEEPDAPGPSLVAEGVFEYLATDPSGNTIRLKSRLPELGS
jgi:catechol-2,3-dioxygenase